MHYYLGGTFIPQRRTVNLRGRIGYKCTEPALVAYAEQITGDRLTDHRLSDYGVNTTIRAERCSPVIDGRRDLRRVERVGAVIAPTRAVTGCGRPCSKREPSERDSTSVVVVDEVALNLLIGCAFEVGRELHSARLSESREESAELLAIWCPIAKPRSH